MSKFIRLLGIAALMTVFALVLLPQGVEAATDEYWTAQYWVNQHMEGEPSSIDQHSSIAFDWGFEPPFAGMPVDNFAIKWSRNIELGAGTYRFTTTADDGMLVTINGEVLINDYSSSARHTVTVDKTLAAGTYFFEVKYYDSAGEAAAFFHFTPLSGGASVVADGWYGEYYNGLGFGGAPIFTRIDADINFNWMGDKPSAKIAGQYENIGSDEFSVRWTRWFNLEPGTYLFHIEVDDGARLFANDTLIMDHWDTRQTEAFETRVSLSGPTQLRLEYFEYKANAEIKLIWFKDGGGTGIISTVPTTTTTITTTPSILDGVGGGGIPTVTGSSILMQETDSGVISDGNSSDWMTVSGGNGGSHIISKNSESTLGNYNWLRWFPPVDLGWYEVHVYIPASSENLTTKARYWVRHARGYTQVVVNQKANAGSWYDLGTYEFAGNGYEFVSLSDVTYENLNTRYVVFDAIQLIPN